MPFSFLIQILFNSVDVSLHYFHHMFHLKVLLEEFLSAHLIFKFTYLIAISQYEISKLFGFEVG